VNPLATAVFWAGIAGILWTFAGYPLLLVFRSWRRPLFVTKTDVTPSICVVITAFNEALHIRDKVLNTLQLDWPRELLEVIVVSDGSTDATEAIAREAGHHNIRVIGLPTRVGKHVCQGIAVRECTSQLVVFTDVTTRLEPGSLRLLVRAFSDNQVGCVSGFDRAISADGMVQGESIYVRYEMALRALEARAGSLVSASGCFFAIRRELCAEWQDDLTSDFALPLSLGLRGLRTVCDTDACCTYRVLDKPNAEFERKVRTVVHGLHTIGRFRACLNPVRTGFFALQLLSHKVMRWGLPFMLIGVLVSSIALRATSAFHSALCAALATVLLIAAAGFVAPAITRFTLVRWSLFSVMVNVAIIVACGRAFVSRPDGVWQPTRR